MKSFFVFFCFPSLVNQILKVKPQLKHQRKLQLLDQLKPTPTPSQSQGDRDGLEFLSSPSSPDPGASIGMSDAEMTTAENLYRDNLSIKVRCVFIFYHLIFLSVI